MEFKTDFLQAKFNEYYKLNGSVATHIFVYSSGQHKIVTPSTNCEVNNIKYSECRSRDGSLSFNWEDTEFVSVGTYNDITIN